MSQPRIYFVGPLLMQPQVIDLKHAPVAQLDRVPGFEPGGREFESLRARHFRRFLITLEVGAVSSP